MNKYIIYILLFCISLPALSQVKTDTIVSEGTTETFTDPPPVADAKDENPPEAVAAPVYANRTFKPGYKDNYHGPEFEYETKALKKTQWDRFKEWLSSLFGSKKSADKNSIDWVDIIIKTIAIIVIGFVIYLIARSVIDKEGMWIFGRSRKKITVSEAQAENIHEMNFKELIEDTKAAGNYRLALRYYYLWLLKTLSYHEIIDWHWDKTNSDYLYEIKDNALRKDFEYLSYVYDHSWYGDFPIDENAFAKAERSFKKTLNTLII